MSKKELILKVLEELNDNSKAPTSNELGIDDEVYGEILEIMQHDNLIFGTNISRGGQGNKVLMLYVDNTKITVRGIEYLEHNNLKMETN